MKSLLIICDGMADRLVNKTTPLEAAKTPNMDMLAKDGICGIMDTVKAGIRPGSDTAHLSLLGYDPYKVYTGRGPFEAAGAGIKLEKGDVAIRCNFSSVINGKVVDRRAGREEYGLEELAKEICGMEIEINSNEKGKNKKNKINVIFKKCSGHRCVVVFRGKGLSPKISDSDPEKEGAPVNESKPLDDTQEAKFTAEILNKFTKKSSEILNNHRINKQRIEMGKLPANAIIARGGGMKPEIESFEKKYGLKSAAIAGVDLIKGVCRIAGLDVIEVFGATGHVDSNIKGKALAAVSALKDYDFVLLHIKGTDEASHDGFFEKKKGMIEKIDKEVLGTIIENCDMKNLNLILTADHTTPISLKKHTADPVPVLIFGDVRTDLVEKFSERSCARGDLGRICGNDLLNILFDLSDRKELFGA